MRKFQKLLVMTLVTALLSSTASLKAEEGDCYEQCCYRKLRPEWAIGGLVVIAVVAVALQNSSHNH